MQSASSRHQFVAQSPGESFAAGQWWSESHALRVSWVLVAGLFILGCRPAEQIETYRVSVPKQPASRRSEPAAPTHRMLAAILSVGEKAWFLKVVGSTAAMDQREKDISDFFASVRVTDGQSRPRWQLPEDWSEQEGSGMRAAAITIPAEPEPLELTVIALPWSGGQSDVLSNVNRWRGQLQLPPIGVQGLADCTRQTTADGTTMTIVDLQGRWKSPGMTAPFAGGQAISASPSSPTASRPNSPQFTVPQSWEEMPAAPPRRAAFRVADGPREALMTVIDFPASEGSLIADPLANLNRWRREIGLAEIAAGELDVAVEEIEVDGQPGSYFAVLPHAENAEESKAERATLAAMVTRDGRVWFFKLSGDRDLVAAQQANFRSFLESMRLGAEGGAGDGN